MCASFDLVFFALLRTRRSFPRPFFRSLLNGVRTKNGGQKKVRKLQFTDEDRSLFENFSPLFSERTRFCVKLNYDILNPQTRILCAQSSDQLLLLNSDTFLFLLLQKRCLDSLCHLRVGFEAMTLHVTPPLLFHASLLLEAGRVFFCSLFSHSCS